MGNVAQIVLRGHLTEAALRSSLESIDPDLAGGARCALLVDVTGITGYDSAARSLFVSWNREHRSRITGVAVVTTNRLWTMVISAMSLASAQKMKPFATRESAVEWCERLRS